ncbi:hypothetical protein SAMN06295945_1540 [Polynucleobacter meluiroseus]|uniref:Uncharacterized protein n=1 Tax=Polynucleobacter meluiroseus TaxID=1938814 RepID=A0A240E154_9BURK|nr:hypothetical protein [Polynucleobacter meluiroseus]SNX29175.1 hypothetical protein SAMN06295945_1540 [Polynucleobacter meluiroseus]
MLYLIFLQILFSAAYYITSPFEMNWSLWAALALNFIALGYLFKHHQIAHELLHRRIRIARIVFTLTIFLLELLILFTPNPVSPDEGIFGLINDGEVLITGILLGVLWRKELLGNGSD